MGCCRSSIIYDPKKFLSIDQYLKGVYTEDGSKRGEMKKRSVKINVRERVNMRQGHLYQFYEIAEVLGEGAFGCVHKGIQTTTGFEVAIKSIPKTFAKRTDDTNAIIEVEILRTLDHPNILKIKEVVEDMRNYHIITELCTGGELFAKILSMKNFSESMASGYMLQLLSALAFCHSHHVLHRDIKPENLLLQTESHDSPLKVIDFGVSNLNYDTSMLNVKQFTSIYYRAPEQFSGMCSEKSDVWSCGVILYLMLSGYLPFKGKNEKQMSESIARQELSFQGIEWENTSEEAKDLIRHMLEKDPELRWSAKEAFKHAWIQNGHSQYLLNRSISESGFKNLSRFRCSIKLKHAALEFIVSQLTHTKELYQLQEAFIAMDYNGDGRLTREELMVACLVMDYSRDEVEGILNECDANMNGYLDYTEFLTAATNWKKLMSKTKLRGTFEAFDLNRDGFINIAELKEMLSNDHNVDEDVWIEIFNEVDINKDGKIDIDEFEEAVLNKDTFR
ncbi:hypothetical protein SteCoe_32068 [Stentor coeruleus]|uniref:non-specific serine/threonine protein kinase n=1 Tax=Stentor coeruleus TaxID=5963 RepID=A0A1R2AZV9_9CILI|nr:hypothetical protein SteCoe_32068 [Stentor coeruleus]